MPTRGEALIDLENVTKAYRMGDEKIFALNRADLKIRQGEFVAVVGPSGSGKTTLANIIGGLDNPDAGDITVSGQNLAHESDRQLSHYRNKKIGFVFQTFNLQPDYSALENVMLPLLFAKVPYRVRKRKAESCLEAVGLKDRSRHKPNQLSGGQRQRVSIARALANDPEIIIADEPTGNLDSKKSQEIIALLKKLNKENGITLIIITHDQSVAREADRIVSITDGKVR